MSAAPLNTSIIPAVNLGGPPHTYLLLTLLLVLGFFIVAAAVLSVRFV